VLDFGKTTTTTTTTTTQILSPPLFFSRSSFFSSRRGDEKEEEDETNENAFRVLVVENCRHDENVANFRLEQRLQRLAVAHAVGTRELVSSRV
jgi:hypothetical protein